MVLYGIYEYGTIRYYTSIYEHGITIWYYTVCTVLYGIYVYGTIRYETVWYGMVLYGTIRYDIVRYDTARCLDGGVDVSLRIQYLCYYC